MKITDVRLRAVKSESELKLKAYADVTFDESFVIHGLKIIDGQKGMFVAMPSRKMPDGEYKDIVHPITPELRKEITDVVIAKYNELGEEEK
ncbi:putative septation protein SpoVG [Fusobacterium sp. DD29]|uniref:septation regulator SpoVG n=1 Tax=unclassified Fusobacterium TaxID=2648384 RepID=UPI001B8CB29B|nr:MULTISPECIES: septation regulator SpoVG [unclassified Fusobacterium]MBR8701444.1 putative septation protein SpoVG [Fusobacterium sp. DD45]MBR8711170.1 putative septation protein SpoVG [Fusobacterium sp. DD28]MBR8749667.1 putative septation protein SpoVG [Fusobacterium sp. DD29]MBR8751744.1 putative septation protein SpoVG [Fusobacterium sp. DD26]MBR8761928.1 putative septation protein SpoVG [Fusobacterium sp. DD25]